MVAAAISAALVGGAVTYGQEPLTAIEAVPVPPVMLVAPGPVTYPTSTASPSGPLGYRLEGWSFDEAPGSFDPFSAPTPQIVPLDGPRPAEAPPPPEPESIPEETAIGSVGERAGGDLLSMPVNGRRTSVFGMRFHPILRVWKLHTGLDFAASCGTPVGAAAAGRVVSAGWAGGNGIQVKVDHGMLAGYRVVTTYNHLSAIGVRVGQQVDALDGVGRVGNTGYSTGCHLHFEVIVNGRFTDPEPWLNGQPSRVELRDIAFLDVDGTTSTTPSLILGLSPSAEASEVPTQSVWDSLIASLTGEPSPSPSVSPSTSLSASPWAAVSASPSISLSDSPSAIDSPSASPSPTPSTSEPPPSDASPLPSASVPESTPPPSSTAPDPTSEAPVVDPTTPAPAPDPTTEAPPPPPPPAPEPEPEPEPEPPPPPPPPPPADPEPTPEAPPPPSEDASATP